MPDVVIEVGEVPPPVATSPSQAVAVTSDGRLVVVSTMTGAEIRELAHRDTKASAWATVEFGVLGALMFPPELVDVAQRAGHHLESLLHHLHPLRR